MSGGKAQASFDQAVAYRPGLRRRLAHRSGDVTPATRAIQVDREGAENRRSRDPVGPAIDEFLDAVEVVASRDRPNHNPEQASFSVPVRHPLLARGCQRAPSGPTGPTWLPVKRPGQA